jgi:hypothetical protein
MVRNALATRPAPKGVLIPVPRHAKYLFCPDSDWLYSTKMSQCEYYPLQRIDPTEWNDNFEGWNVTDDGVHCKLSIDKLRSLKPHEGKQVTNIQNAPTTNAADFKGKFLIGSIHKETGAVSFTTFPARQPTLSAAKKEAARLAQTDKTKMFMAVEVQAIATVQDVVFL